MPRAGRRGSLSAAVLWALLALVALAVYAVRDWGCFGPMDADDEARYAECLRSGRWIGGVALGVLGASALGAVWTIGLVLARRRHPG